MNISSRFSALCFAGLVLASSAPVAAFSDPSTFVEPASMGGGGGRFFTGGPADGYSCAVCHSGPPGLNLTVHGLPQVYKPGFTYDLTVTWGAGISDVAATLEIVDGAGRAAGELVVPPVQELRSGAQCFPGFSAAQVFPLRTVGGGQRQVLGAAACAATLIQARWTAPIVSPGAIELVGGLVKGEARADPDANATPELDRVTLLRHPLQSASSLNLPARTHPLGCSVSCAGMLERSAPLPALLIALGLALRLARAARMGSRPGGFRRSLV